jgi:ADP-dependent NAD(P)H-hydrate dehydratase / NAD(P)H-hydrate epimerase
MKIFSAKQMKDWDAYTIKHEGVTELDLMDNAATVVAQYIIDIYSEDFDAYTVVCGSGNNGGDGMAIAKILAANNMNVNVIWCKTNKPSPSFFEQMNTLPTSIPFESISEGDELPEIDEHSLIIDAIFGTGLNRSVKGYWADLICRINDEKSRIISVDMPSGMLADFYTDGVSIQADEVICLETPKLGLFMASNLHRFEEVMHERIGLNIIYAIETHTDHFLTEKSDIYILLKNRYKTDHKGRFGHALMFMGKEGMMGAAVLAAKACMRTGVGKCTIHAPKCGRDVLQMSIPEVMVSVDENEKHISQHIGYEDFNAIAIGCGIGTHRETAAVLAHLFETADKPLILDADALNILAQNQELMTFIPKGTIITPHIKEFDRLFGNSPNVLCV